MIEAEPHLFRSFVFHSRPLPHLLLIIRHYITFENCFIVSECCLTSNVVCGTAKNYETHHLQEWIKNALPFTLSVSIIFLSRYIPMVNIEFLD
jgi:hypothetical protein